MHSCTTKALTQSPLVNCRVIRDRVAMRLLLVNCKVLTRLLLVNCRGILVKVLTWLLLAEVHAGLDRFAFILGETVCNNSLHLVCLGGEWRGVGNIT